MKLRTFLTRAITRLVPAAILGVCVVGGITAATASGPQFNILKDDFPTLQVAHPHEAYDTKATASVGDDLYLYVWAHDGIPETKAIDSFAKVVIPDSTATTQNITGSVYASNATSASSAVRITLTSAARITYIQDSAELLKNDGNGNMVTTSWPDNVNPNDIVSAKGVSIGDILGCWTNVRAVRLRVHVDGITPQITTNKQVGLSNASLFANSVAAQPGDAVAYKIYVENTGDGTAKSPTVVDTLDSHHTYLAGTSYAVVKQNNNDYNQPIPDANIKIETLADGRQQLSYQFVDMPARPDTAFYLIFQARLKDKTAFPVGTTVMPNVAHVCFNSGAICKDTNQTTITVVRQADAVVSFTLSKQVVNYSNGDTTWKDDLFAPAAPGDIVSFRLITTNTGNTDAANTYVKDVLPAGMTYLTGTAKLYTVKNGINGVAIHGEDLFTANGYNLGTVTPGTPGAEVIIFNAKLTDQCTGQTTLVNKGQVIYLGQVKAEDTASVLLGCTRGLLIQKTVKSLDGIFSHNGGTFPESKTVTYQIVVSNSGNTTAMNPVLTDNMPAGLTYIPNSLSIDGEFMSQAVQDAFNSKAGIVLTNFTPGMSKTILFQMRISDCPNYGDTTLTNTATVKADGIDPRSDSADITVHVDRPTLTF